MLQKLGAILQEYAVHEGLATMSEKEASLRLIQLKTFGSYRLGAHSPEADIDAYRIVAFAVFLRVRLLTQLYCIVRKRFQRRLCIAPRHCSRASFFQKAPILLETSQNVSEVHVISDAYDSWPHEQYLASKSGGLNSLLTAQIRTSHQAENRRDPSRPPVRRFEHGFYPS